MDDQAQTEDTNVPKAGEATFALDPNDQRTVENRGGIDAVMSEGPTGHAASGDTTAGGGAVGITGVGPTEGSAAGATAPRVEMTDVGLVDVNAADMSLPDDGTTGARAEDENGNVL
jgi:hypothetical protein